MHIPFRTIVNEYIDDSKPITGIVHIGPYNADLHDQYKCYTKAKVTWIDRNDLYRIEKAQLFNTIEAGNFINVNLNGNESQILESFGSFIYNHVDYIYTQIYSSDESSGGPSTFRSMNELMSIYNFSLKAFKMVDGENSIQTGGALYKRVLTV